MASLENAMLEDVEFDELESADQYEVTFSGLLDNEEITLTYTLESAIEEDETTTVYTPGDEELESILVQPETYEFESDDRDTVRFTASNDDGEELFLVYAFTEAEDASSNTVSLEID